MHNQSPRRARKSPLHLKITYLEINWQEYPMIVQGKDNQMEILETCRIIKYVSQFLLKFDHLYSSWIMVKTVIWSKNEIYSCKNKSLNIGLVETNISKYLSEVPEIENQLHAVYGDLHRQPAANYVQAWTKL